MFAACYLHYMLWNSVPILRKPTDVFTPLWVIPVLQTLFYLAILTDWSLQPWKTAFSQREDPKFQVKFEGKRPMKC
jgi:hypothetical protein